MNVRRSRPEQDSAPATGFFLRGPAFSTPAGIASGADGKGSGQSLGAQLIRGARRAEAGAVEEAARSLAIILWLGARAFCGWDR